MNHKTKVFNQFVKRHIGPNQSEIQKMLDQLQVKDLDQLIDQTIPKNIRKENDLKLPPALTEYELLQEIREIASTNKTYKSFIGKGYHNTIVPPVIQRNIFENPGWYTQYTPYQAEISQGRLEALLNFQTMVSDLTALPLSNASLLDEATAAAEAMAMSFNLKNKRTTQYTHYYVSDQVHPHSIDVMRTRAQPIGIELIVGKWQEFQPDAKTSIGVLLQYPGQNGVIEDIEPFIRSMADQGMYVSVAADLMALVMLKAPGDMGAHCAIGTTQRFGIPMGYGGPHAAYFACQTKFMRSIPGRIIGVSVDKHGKKALRMALQTREQHIRRDKATSNICTAQALLAIMAGMYAVYHGPKGLFHIAQKIHAQTQILHHNLKNIGYEIINDSYFDTITIRIDTKLSQKIRRLSTSNEMNFNFFVEGQIGITVDETTQLEDIDSILAIFADAKDIDDPLAWEDNDLTQHNFPTHMIRKSDFLTHPVFNSYHTETKMMRYIKSLENKDLSLTHSMISLGSCTMKLNAVSQLMPVSWAEFAHIHPFVDPDQVSGYKEIINDLETYLSEITGFNACSLQPNSGAQGELAGLMVIRNFFKDIHQSHRNVALIPQSAHGTNPASAVMAGMRVVVVATDERGNIDFEDLKRKVDHHSDNLAVLMITYPSTHGVFEAKIKEVCSLIHQHGGRVYMDGANMNAQVGLTSPGLIGADVCHLNLHKTFAIPHGGGGPGMGPICVTEELTPFLPGHVTVQTGGSKAGSAISAAPYGSASILLISYAYIRLLGPEGLTESTKVAILNANYIMHRLEDHFQVLYTGDKGRVAHELILDLRPFKSLASAEDVAKRLIDYGFHAPTLSFPVPGTIMIEPTESESLDELDRFCDALIAIKNEVNEIATGGADIEDNVLKNAPHTLAEISADEWSHVYSRTKAAYPLAYLHEGHKFWASVARVNNAAGDRNLVCTCPPIESYLEPGV